MSSLTNPLRAWTVRPHGQFVISYRSLQTRDSRFFVPSTRPFSFLFQAFDQVLLLQRGGKSLYFGEIGPSASTFKAYFESRGAKECLGDDNPAEPLLAVAGSQSHQESAIDRSTEWHAVCRISANTASCSERESTARESADRVSQGSRDQYATPFVTQLLVLTSRNLRQGWRTPNVPLLQGRPQYRNCKRAFLRLRCSC